VVGAGVGPRLPVGVPAGADRRDAGRSSSVAEVLASTRPGLVALLAIRGDRVPWSGLVWARGYRSASRQVPIVGQGWWSYWRRRFITWDAAFAGVDQASIVTSLLARAALETAGDVGFTVSAPATGRLRDRAWFAYERKNLGEAVEQLAAVSDGFDFYVDTIPDGSALYGYRRRFRLGYPRFGRIGSASPLAVALPGDLLTYAFDDDATSAANRVHAIGAGQGESQQLQTVTDTASVTGGWPLLEARQSLTDVKEPATLLAHAIATLADNTNATRVWTLHALHRDEQPLGTWEPGDDLRLTIQDDAFPSGYDATLRCVGASVTPGDGRAPETVDYACLQVST
jgi:hypothetical protein